jgi:PAS domain S-box-containing protein
MNRKLKTRQMLLKELETMHAAMDRLESCQKEFHRAQEKYEVLLDTAPDAMVFVDPVGTIVLANAQAEKLFGYSQKELTGRGLDCLVPERYRERHAKEVAGFFEHKRTRHMGAGLHISARKKDGSEFPVDISLSTQQIEDELLVVAAIRDMTEQQQATERIKLNYHIQRVISSILKISLEPVSLEEQLGRILDEILSVPGLALQSKGIIYLVEDEEVLVMKAQRGTSPAQCASCTRVPFGKCLCGKAAATGKVVFVDSIEDCHEIRYEGISPHGHYCVPVVCDQTTLGLISIPVEEGHKRSKVEEQFLVAIADTLAGIIERKDAEKALRESEEEYRTLVENVNVGVYRNTGGPQGRFLQANPAIAKMFGYDSVAEFMDCSVAELYQSPEERQRVVDEILKKGFIKDKELRLRKRDGTPIWASFTARAQMDEDGKLKWFDGVIEEITERKQAEKEKQILQEQLAEAEKLAALGRLTQNIAHEIRNPLTAVGGFARRLRGDVKDPAKEEEYIQSILAAVTRLEATLKDVLAYSDEVGLKLEQRPIQEILDAVIADHAEICQRRCVRIQEVYGEERSVLIDAVKVRQGIKNVIVNAIDAMPEGGTLTIETDIESVKGLDYQVVKIGDTGGGIPEEKLGMIFEPFFVLKKTSGATNLGLPISKKIAEEHGGFIRVESRVGRGSTFSLYFPIQEDRGS